MYRDGFSAATIALVAVVIPLTGVLLLTRQWMLGRRFGYVTPAEMLADYSRAGEAAPHDLRRRSRPRVDVLRDRFRRGTRELHLRRPERRTLGLGLRHVLALGLTDPLVAARRRHAVAACLQAGLLDRTSADDAGPRGRASVLKVETAKGHTMIAATGNSGVDCMRSPSPSALAREAGVDEFGRVRSGVFNPSSASELQSLKRLQDPPPLPLSEPPLRLQDGSHGRVFALSSTSGAQDVVKCLLYRFDIAEIIGKVEEIAAGPRSGRADHRRSGGL